MGRKCQRPGCKNLLPPNKNKNARFCDDSLCQSLRVSDRMKKWWRKKHPLFELICPACKKPFKSNHRRRKFCYDKGCLDQRERERNNKANLSKKNEAACPPPLPELSEVIENNGKEIIESLPVADGCGATVQIAKIDFSRLNQDILDRSQKSKFVWYMEANPFYLGSVFPNMTPEQAWADMNKTYSNLRC